jgi:uncharacterized protein (TIGR00297 family)
LALEPAILILLLLSGVIVSEIAARKKWISEIFGRKLLHLFAGSIVLRIMTIVDDSILLTIIGLTFTILLFVIIEAGILKEVNSTGRKSWGIVLFPLSFSLLMIFAESSLTVAILSFSILTFSDSLAALSGILFAKKTYYLGTDKKSYLGSTVFFISTVVVLSFYFFIASSSFSALLLLLILIVSFIITVVEALSSKGSDNLFVPIFSAILIKLILIEKTSALPLDLLVGFILGLLTAILSFKYRLLTKDGAASTFILAFFIYGFGGLKWTIPIFTFFMLSSILSKIPKKKNNFVEERFDKSGQRDASQVIANGAVGLVLILLNSFFHNELFYTLYVIYMAAMCADTWGTEIGTYFNYKTYSVLTFKEVAIGVSGGVSVLGTLGAISGAFIVSISSYYWMDSFWFIILISSIAFISSIIDSVLGSTIQVQYKCNICKLDTEKDFHCENKTQIVSGFKLINNNVVNFLSGIIVLFIFYIMILFEVV